MTILLHCNNMERPCEFLNERSFVKAPAAMSLIQPLPPGPLDIVGDIHGELHALQALLRHLGYDETGRHPQARTLVFVGDFVDRGPDSPGVVDLVQRLVEGGYACAIAGNHEINLLRHDPKDGAGWFFEERIASDTAKYSQFARATNMLQRARIETFLNSLPLGLERHDLRVIHAAWHAPDIAKARQMPLGTARAQYDHWEAKAAEVAREQRIAEHMAEENAIWPHSLEDGERCPPFLQAHCDNELNKALINPLKVLTCGLERQTPEPFFAGNKWRFVERVAWWNSYTEDTPVVVGHYWRSTLPAQTTHEGLFRNVGPFAWHGRRGNVFCVDYSVGARAQARTFNRPHAHMKLAALRWPERTLVFDDGSTHDTNAFMQSAQAQPA